MGNSPTTQAKSIRRTAAGALLATLLLAASGSTAVTSVDSDDNWLSGCPGTMVIANEDCRAGISPSSHFGQQVDVINSVPVVFAPWCDGQIDTMRYGCPGILFTPIG